MDASVKKLPYGISSFPDLIDQNMYYVDKTMYLPLLERQPNNLFLIRPRRFGKSLFLSMLRSYYDLSQKDRFAERFKGLYISEHPTLLQGSYQILYFDFSRAGGSLEQLQENFDAYCCLCLDNFAQIYASYYPEGFEQELKSMPTSNAKLNYLDLQAKAAGNSLFLIIDEYDNFTNVVLNERGTDTYIAMTHASGFYREAFKKYKGMFARIFMMGVSPVTLDDLTSGFNIGWNISTDFEFNMMLGFSETDVREMFGYYQEAGLLQGDIDAMIAEMKPWYDNYCFAKQSLKCDPRMFNSDMVLYYLNYRMKLNESPEQMIDPNTRTDYNKMKRLIRFDKLDGDRKGVIRKIAEEGRIITSLATSFPAADIMKAEIFPSLLYYYGMLTITGTMGDRLILSIPNNNVRKQYYEYLLEEFQEKNKRYVNLNDLSGMYYDMSYDGQWRPALQFIADAYKDNSSVRSSIEGERNLQGFFTAYLSISSYYLTAPEVELNHGFCDLFLMPDLQRYPEVQHCFILELKYLPARDFDARAEAQWQEAVAQIHRYAQGPRVQQMIQGTELHLIVLQFNGWELARMEEVTSVGT